MSDPLWTQAAPRSPFEGDLMEPVTDEMRAAEQQPSEPVPPPPPRDPNLPAWRAERMNCKVMGRVALLKFVRFESLNGDVGQILSRRRDEALAEWLEGEVPQKYLRLRDQLTKAEEERIAAGRREAQASMAYTKAIQTNDAKAEAEEWEAARAQVADIAVRIVSIQEATNVAYAAAHDSYRQHNDQIQSGSYSTACQTYSQALEELGAAISPLLDKVYEAACLRDRQQTAQAKRVEEVLPSPTLPADDLSPPAREIMQTHPAPGCAANRPRPRSPVNAELSEPAAV